MIIGSNLDVDLPQAHVFVGNRVGEQGAFEGDVVAEQHGDVGSIVDQPGRSKTWIERQKLA